MCQLDLWTLSSYLTLKSDWLSRLIDIFRFNGNYNNVGSSASADCTTTKFVSSINDTKERKEIGSYREDGLMSKLLLHSNCYMQKSYVSS